MKILAVIPARDGSKGIGFKNCPGLVNQESIFYRPTLAIRRSYIVTWLKVLKISPAIKRLRKVVF